MGDNQVTKNIKVHGYTQLAVFQKINPLPFLELADNLFLKSNAFQTFFFITFGNENIFLRPLFKNITGFFIDLI